jgi:hypothetical protein
VKPNINSVEVHPLHNLIKTGMQCMMNRCVLLHPKSSSFVPKKKKRFVPFSAMGKRLELKNMSIINCLDRVRGGGEGRRTMILL